MEEGGGRERGRDVLVEYSGGEDTKAYNVSDIGPTLQQEVLIADSVLCMVGDGGRCFHNHNSCPIQRRTSADPGCASL